MSNNAVQNASMVGDKLKLIVAFVVLALGLFGYYFLSDKSSAIRMAVLFAGVILAIIVVSTSSVGRSWINFARESVRETRKVVWPKRKEAVQITAIVFAFLLVMAIFLWGTDSLLEFLLYDVILGWKR